VTYTVLTEKQMQEAVDASMRYGSQTIAAAKLNVNRSTLTSRLQRARAAGYKPSPEAVQARSDDIQASARAETPIHRPTDGFEVRSISTGVDENGKLKSQWIGERLEGRATETVPEGHIVKGLSTLVDETGKTRAQWIKTAVDENKTLIMVDAACRAAMSRVKPLQRVVAPKRLNADLLTQYTITDYHIGMLAWHRETGASWDLDIAERVLIGVLDRMIDAAPASAVGLLAQLGDFLHFDSMKSITPEHGHLLDSDSRFPKLVEVAVRVIRHIVLRMLTKHKEVWVELMEGNHDPASSIWLRAIFGILFENNPRVKVGQSPRPYVAHQWGETFLGFHHGHLSKKQSLPQLFAAMFREMWGQTKKGYIHTGHLHHVDEKEYPGVKVIQHATLAAPDAYAARGGWLSERQVVSMTYHNKQGEIARGIFLPSE
jgi:hypothetical protein